MTVEGKPILLGVTGCPILHSKSPLLHSAALGFCGFNGASVRLAAANADEALSLAQALELSALNITAPFKERAAELIASIDPVVASLRCSNLVQWQSGAAFAFNTDCEGVVLALQNSAFGGDRSALKGKRVLVLGSGAAAKAAAYGLAVAQAHVVVAGRNAERLKSLEDQLFALCPVAAVSLDPKSPHFLAQLAGAEIIIGCLGTDEEVIPPDLFSDNQVVLEAFYARDSSLLRAARRAGCKIVPAEEWLIYQAIKAFEIVFDASPSAEQLRSEIATSEWKLPAEKCKKSRRLAITGCMGVGKTAVSEALGARLNLPVVHLDKEIEKRSGRKIVDIFASEGEQEFRRLEQEALNYFSEHEDYILDCGGGLVTRPDNRTILRDKFVNILLWALPTTLATRLSGEEVRPLLLGRDRLEAVTEILSERRLDYLSCADLVIGTDAYSPREVAQQITHELESCCW